MAENPDVKKKKCFLCEKLRKPTKHRLIPGRRGGTYDPMNVVILCPSCHNDVDWITGVSANQARKFPVKHERAMELRRVIRARLSVDRLHYLRRQMGQGWLDKFYPPDALRAEKPKKFSLWENTDYQLDWSFSGGWN